MEEEIIERTVQLNRGSFILTIPQAIAREAGIRKGQGVRFRVRDGEIVISPTGVLGGSESDSAGPDKYERAIEEMMAKDSAERSGGRGTASGKSKLERLRSNDRPVSRAPARLAAAQACRTPRPRNYTRHGRAPLPLPPPLHKARPGAPLRAVGRHVRPDPPSSSRVFRFLGRRAWHVFSDDRESVHVRSGSRTHVT